MTRWPTACRRGAGVGPAPRTSRTTASGRRSATPPAPYRWVAQGDETDLASGTALGNLPDGRYLVSVTADGYKIDGQHFTVTGRRHHRRDRQHAALPAATGHHPHPGFSTTTSRSTAPTRWAPRRGIAGFTAHLADVLGEVTTDYYGKPAVHPVPALRAGLPRTRRARSSSTPASRSSPRSRPAAKSDANGDIVIPEPGPRPVRPRRLSRPPVAPGCRPRRWKARTTGTSGCREGDTGYDTEQTVGGEAGALCGLRLRLAQGTDRDGGPGEIVGFRGARPHLRGRPGRRHAAQRRRGRRQQSPARSSQPWVALSDLGKRRPDGVPGPGRRQRLVRHHQRAQRGLPAHAVGRSTGDDPGLVQRDRLQWTETRPSGPSRWSGWFTEITGSVYIDANANGVARSGRGSAVPRFPESRLKERDNSVMDQGTNTVTTDNNGNYAIKEAYPMGKVAGARGVQTRGTRPRASRTRRTTSPRPPRCWVPPWT